MRVSGHNLSMTRGDSESITVSCVDVNGSPVDFVTGDTIYFTVKENVNTTTKILQKTITTFTDGTAIIEIAHDDTKDLRCKDYYYDIQLTRADTTVTTIISPSRFTIEGEVTYE